MGFLLAMPLKLKGFEWKKLGMALLNGGELPLAVLKLRDQNGSQIFPKQDFYQKRTSGFVLPWPEGHDIDTEEDFNQAEIICKGLGHNLKRKLKKNQKNDDRLLGHPIP